MKNYIIIRQASGGNKPDKNINNSDIKADFTINDFLENYKLKNNISVLYIHFNDIAHSLNRRELWSKIQTKCTRCSISNILFFTTKNIGEWKNDPTNPSEKIYVVSWSRIKDNLGNIEHPCHKPPRTKIYTIALFILCQGFLYEHYNPENQDQSYRNLLKNIGLNSENLDFIKSITAKRQKAKKYSDKFDPYWKTLGDDPQSIINEITSELAAIQNNQFDKIEPLIKNIYNSKNNINTKWVEELYFILHNTLKQEMI